MSSSLTNRPAWARRARGHLSLARISNSPTVLTNTLAGAALGGMLVPGVDTWLLALALVLFYTAGMYLNDLLDHELDARERPERPLPSGLIPVNEAWGVTVGLVAAGLLLLAVVSAASLLWGVALGALIYVYDRWHKANPLSPLLMAGTRMLVYVTASSAFSPAVTPALIGWTLLLGLYTVGMTQIAKTERRTDLSRYWPAALLLLPAVYLLAAPGRLTPLLTAFLVAFLAWVGYSVSFLYSPARRDVGRAVGHLIAGLSLLDALVLAQLHAPATVLLLALLAFLLTLFWQRVIKGT